MNTVTVLGGYGVFGSRIASSLAGNPNAAVRVAGRNPRIGRRFAERLGVEFRCCDLADRASVLAAISGSHVVVHTAGPFQGSDYRVAELCLECGSHYVDIADGRAFVSGISVLDPTARARGLAVVSGASSVPAVTAAMIRELLPSFQVIREIQIALSPGNQNPRGAATIAAVLSYLGRPIRVWQDGQWTNRPGWGDACIRDFPRPVRRRRVYNCDSPDMELFPTLFTAQTVRFQAGVELNLINRALSWLAWLQRRLKFEDLPRIAPLCVRLSELLRFCGSKAGGLAVWMSGLRQDGTPVERRIAVVTDADGPAVACAPAIALVKRILDGLALCAGAYPCVKLLSLQHVLAAVPSRRVWIVTGNKDGWKENRHG